MAGALKANWKMTSHVEKMWDVPDDDVVVNYVVMEWTANSTGRTVTLPAIHLLHFRDGKIAKAEIFLQDTKALLDTLEPD